MTIIKSEKKKKSEKRRAPAPAAPHGGFQVASFTARWQLKTRSDRLSEANQSGHFAACLGATARRSCPGVPPGVAESPAQAGSADMLPKVETESLGLSRSYGEHGLMPRNMQGKNCHHFKKNETHDAGLQGSHARTQVHGAHRSVTKTFEGAAVTFVQKKQPNFPSASHSVLQLLPVNC